jgi:sugar O-acyltransferase (sialic acid O-acetyltransferase NeuD family)
VTAPVVIFGMGDAAELAHHCFVQSGRQVAGFCVDAAYLTTTTFRGLSAVAFEEATQAFPPALHAGFVAIGYRRLNRVRAEKAAAMRDAGYRLASCVSPQAIHSADLWHGDNCFIMEGVILQPQVQLGRNVTVWSGAHVAHHSTIGDDCFLAPRVAIAGRVVIEERCFLGINATIRDHVRIGRDSVVGAGATVLQDLPPGSLVLPAPATHGAIAQERLA